MHSQTGLMAISRFRADHRPHGHYPKLAKKAQRKGLATILLELKKLEAISVEE
jgi:hypothetical protein